MTSYFFSVRLQREVAGIQHVGFYVLEIAGVWSRPFRVVNGGQLVSTATAARVRAAIKKLGYEPNESSNPLLPAYTASANWNFADISVPVSLAVLSHDLMIPQAQQRILGDVAQ